MTVEIRIAREADANGILAIYAPYCESTHVSFETVAPTPEQMRERIARIGGDYPWIVGETDGRLAGYVYASRHRERAAYRWAVDVAVYIAEEEKRRGLGRALYQALFSILREQEYFQAIAGISLPNPASVGLHESMGFHHAAIFRGVGYKHSSWLDVGWWQLNLQPPRPDPPEPRAFSTIKNSIAVAAALAEGRRRWLLAKPQAC